MRERRHTVVHRAPGAVEFTTELLDDAGFAQRMAELKASVLARLGPLAPLAGFAEVRCDGGCGTVKQVDFIELALPPGWTSGEAGELCPRCSAGVN